MIFISTIMIIFIYLNIYVLTHEKIKLTFKTIFKIASILKSKILLIKINININQYIK